MTTDIEARLDELKQEFARGQKMLQDAELRRAEIEQTLIRISGAIQVLEELLGESPQTENGSTPVAAPVAT
jgi:hypothetical protein